MLISYLISMLTNWLVGWLVGELHLEGKKSLFELLRAFNLMALHVKYFKKFTLRIRLIFLVLLEVLKRAFSAPYFGCCRII